MEATWWTKPEQLDPDQKKAVSLPLTGNHLIVGPPGSGKTNLVLLRAAYLQAKGQSNFLVFTFGRVLREFLASGTDAARVSPDKIVTYNSWATGVVMAKDPKIKLSNKFKDRRSELLAHLQGMTDEEVLEHSLDCILLDECQDYTKDEIKCLRRFSAQIYAAGDHRQRIFESEGAIKLLQADCTTTELKYHFRNGKKICRVADGIMGQVDAPHGLQATAQYKESEMASRVDCHDPEPLADQISRAVPEIENQLKAYPKAMIGVLCPRREDVKEVYEQLSNTALASDIQLQLMETGYEPMDPDRRVLVGTLAGAKGLEFRAVHLLGMDRLATIPDATKRTRLAYTAVTRAKTSLDIYRAGELIGRLDNGLNALNAPDTPVALTDLFRS